MEHGVSSITDYDVLLARREAAEKKLQRCITVLMLAHQVSQA